jgi:3'(2'), 5'-bisphosphate nucleotidase
MLPRRKRVAAELQTALDAARQAGTIIAEAYRRFEAIPDARADISTEADRQAQETILRCLHERFPTDALCAEEQTPTLAAATQTGPRLWIVDPIDGTRGFAKKNGEFSVMIALVQDGVIALGVVLEPAVQRLTYAVRGGGCWRLDGTATQPVRCTVSKTALMTEAILAQSHSKRGEISGPVRTLKPKSVRETYSAGVKLALVARGEVDLYVNTYTAFHDWDICAGHILVEEAGGRVSGLHGEELRYGIAGAWQRHGLLATNGVLHAASLEGLQG